MPLRNLFKRSGNLEGSVIFLNGESGFNAATVAGAKPIEAPEPVEYQLSEISDSGVFIPPSPAATKPSFWHSKSSSSLSSTSLRNGLSDSEPFNMSRESFDSFRRSFDISARSPVSTRPSIDSSLYLSSTRPSLSEQRKSDWTEDDEPVFESTDSAFEDVGLNDDSKQPQSVQKKRSLFARFASNDEEQKPASNTSALGIKSTQGFQLFAGRKRGQSGQGAELRSMSGVPVVVTTNHD